MLPAEAQRLLRDDERATWSGRPDPAAWWASALTGLAFLVACLQVVVVPVWRLAGSEAGGWALGAVLALAAAIALLEAWWYRNLLYVLTPRRIILQKGFVGRDFDIVDLSRVTDYSVRVGLWDKLLGRGTGSITVRTASDAPAMGVTGRVLRAVPGVYDVQARFLLMRDAAVQDVRDVTAAAAATPATPRTRAKAPPRGKATASPPPR